jgi:hypothetical protein
MPVLAVSCWTHGPSGGVIKEARSKARLGSNGNSGEASCTSRHGSELLNYTSMAGAYVLLQPSSEYGHPCLGMPTTN